MLIKYIYYFLITLCSATKHLLKMLKLSDACHIFFFLEKDMIQVKNYFRTDFFTQSSLNLIAIEVVKAIHFVSDFSPRWKTGY